MTTKKQVEFEKLRKVIHLRLFHCPMTTGELAEKLGTTPRKVADQMRVLKRNGMVRMVGYKQSAPIWASVKREKPAVVDGFKPQPFDRNAFALQVRGTPWQGVEAFAA